MQKIRFNNKVYYQDEKDNRCSTCVFNMMPIDFCMKKQIKCLSVSNMGGKGNWKELKP